MFSIEAIKKIAKLANLTLTQEEENKLVPQLSSILDYFEKLKTVDTSRVVLHANHDERSNRFKNDQAGDPLTSKEALKNAKNHDDKYFLVSNNLELL
jgi:aspartyl-tRNA(Asn)/glutamyl-tRNA(Gln) amidotransferase subunit C